jgi:hypothetical protein
MAVYRPPVTSSESRSVHGESSASLQTEEEPGFVEGRIIEIEAILREARESDETGRRAAHRRRHRQARQGQGSCASL